MTAEARSKGTANCTKVRFCVVVAILCLLAGCSYLADPKQLVPALDQRVSSTVNQTVQILDVRVDPAAEELTVDGMFKAALTPDSFKIALLTSLRQAKTFANVSPDTGELRLRATIKAWRGEVPVYRSRLLVNYEFADNNNRIVWSETYESEYGDNSFGGVNRRTRGIEGAVRENIKSLIDGLAERPPK